MNLLECAWMCLYKQDSEYFSGSKYAKILNMIEFWILQGSQYASVKQRSECARLYMFWQSYIRIYIGFLICQDSEYGRVLNMQELYRFLDIPQNGWICLNRTWICLNMSEFTIIDKHLSMYCTIYSARKL